MRVWIVFLLLSVVVRIEIRTLRIPSFENGELYVHRTFTHIVLYCESFLIAQKCVQKLNK